MVSSASTMRLGGSAPRSERQWAEWASPSSVQLRVDGRLTGVEVDVGAINIGMNKYKWCVPKYQPKLSFTPSP